MSERMEYVDLLIGVLVEHEKNLSREIDRICILSETMTRQMMKMHNIIEKVEK